MSEANEQYTGRPVRIVRIDVQYDGAPVRIAWDGSPPIVAAYCGEGRQVPAEVVVFPNEVFIRLGEAVAGHDLVWRQMPEGTYRITLVG